MTTDVIEDIISLANPELVPLDYIVMAKVVDFKGEEMIIRGEELRAMMNDSSRNGIAEARVILNVKKMRQDLIQEIDSIYEEVNKMFNMKL
jgi:hypothetical protein